MMNEMKIKVRCAFLLMMVFLLNSCSTDQSTKPIAHTVEITGMKFQPEKLLVQKGDTVTWINHDIVTHDITEQPGKAWSSSALPTGKSWSMVVEKSTDYYCSIHPVMKGSVEVQ
jgi:plastocyanin